MLAEQDNFNTNSTKETNVGLRLKKKGLLCNQSPPRRQLSIKKNRKKEKKKKKERQVENPSYTWMNCQWSKSFMYVEEGLAFHELSPN